MTPAAHLTTLLQKNAPLLHPVLPLDLNSDQVVRLNFTKGNSALSGVDLLDTRTFEEFVRHQLGGASIGIGGYLEPRVIYLRSDHFGSGSSGRNIHLGVDVWAPAFTPVAAPLPARIHSFADNANFGDYGPTVLLEHRLEDTVFYTLYGHLSRHSLEGLFVGKQVEAGEFFGELGPYPENGDWPPHLHFQVIADLGGRSGDFPGVADPAEAAFFASICPDPNLMLSCRLLDEWISG